MADKDKKLVVDVKFALKNKEPKSGHIEIQNTKMQWWPDGESNPFDINVAFDIQDIFVNKKAPDKHTIPRMKLDVLKKGLTSTYMIEFKTWNDRDTTMQLLKDTRTQSKVQKEPEKNLHVAVPLPEAETVKARLLSKDKELLTLHTQLVRSGLLTENEFWSDPQRQSMLQVIKETMIQETGMQSQYFTADIKCVNNGTNITYTLNKRNIQDIFRELPLVKKAYLENVPGNMSEVKFWELFFKSHFFNRGEKRKDDMFANLTNEDEGSKSKPIIDPSLDLTMTETSLQGYGLKNFEDPLRWKHKDIKSSAQTVIEQFNRHSSIVLESTLKSPQADEDQTASQLVAQHNHLEDLEEIPAPLGVPLTVSNRSKYFDIDQASNKEQVVQDISNKDRMIKYLQSCDTNANSWSPVWLSDNETMKSEHQNQCMKALQTLNSISSKGNQEGNKSAQENDKYGISLASHTRQVAEVLRHFWSITFTASSVQESATKRARCEQLILELYNNLQQEHERMDVEIRDQQGPPLMALCSCLSAALARIREEKWSGTGMNGPSTESLKRSSETRNFKAKLKRTV